MKNTNFNNKNKYLVGGEPFYYKGNNGKGVLLLHGFTSTPYQVKQLGRFLNEKGYTVYAPLFAGHGTEPKDLAKTRHKDWIQSGLDGLNELNERVNQVYIIGTSLGGNVALYLAHQYSDKINGIVVLGTPIYIHREGLVRYVLPIYKYFIKYLEKSRDDYRGQYIDYSDEVCYSVIPSKPLHDFFLFVKEKLVPILPEIKTPTLIIHANQDPWSNPKSAQYIHQNLGSRNKKIYWVETDEHTVIHGFERFNDVFERIARFVEET
jgi:carboxylesterase